MYQTDVHQRSRYFSPACPSLGDLYKVSVLATSRSVKYQLASSSLLVVEPLSISGVQHRACCWESLTVSQDAKYEEEHRQHVVDIAICLLGADRVFASPGIAFADEVTVHIGWHERVVRVMARRTAQFARAHPIPDERRLLRGHSCTCLCWSAGALPSRRIVSRRPY